MLSDYNVHYYSFVKNVLQFSVGVGVAYALFGVIPDVSTVFFALGFLFSYQSVYYMNDIIDMESDAKDPIKRKIKPLARDKTKLKNYALKMFVLLFTGLVLISFHTNSLFKFAVFCALITNLFHSAGLKNTPLSGVNMVIMEWSKFASGYFAIAQEISLPAVVFLLSISGGYTFAYGVYKNISKGLKESIIVRWYNTLIGGFVGVLSLFLLYYVGSNLFLALLVGFASVLPVVFLYPRLSPMSRLTVGGVLTLLPYLVLIAYLVAVH